MNSDLDRKWQIGYTTCEHNSNINYLIYLVLTQSSETEIRFVLQASKNWYRFYISKKKNVFVGGY